MTHADTATALRGHEVCVLTGCTYRQLDAWCKAGIAVSSIASANGSGSQRLFAPNDLAAIRTAVLVSQTYANPQQGSGVLGWLKRLPADLASIVAERPDDFLVVTPTEIRIAGTRDLVDELTLLGGMAVVIALVELHVAVQS